jgi:hypothetical protein
MLYTTTCTYLLLLLSIKLPLYLLLYVVNICLYLPPPLYLTNYLSIYLLLYVVNINLCLTPPFYLTISLSYYLSIVINLYLPHPPLYLTISISIYCFKLYTSICTYLLLLHSILLSKNLYILI